MVTVAVDQSPAVTSDSTPDLMELICQRRGWSEEFLRSIEVADHSELLGMPQMIDALHHAWCTGARIVIAPDFDMDGIASGVLGYAGLSELGFVVDVHVPDYERGHDLTAADIDEIHAAHPDTRVLLTCDGGVNSHRGINAAHERGWQVLITDHHEELAPRSRADVIVNPCRLDETYAHPGICGAHVLWQVLDAYARTYRPDKMWEIHLLRLFAGLGTVSDVMPVVFENRPLIRDSLSIARMLWVAPTASAESDSDPDLESIDVSTSTLLQLMGQQEHSEVFVRAFVGFALWLKELTIEGVIRDTTAIDEQLYGFSLAPAMNSPRRTGGQLRPCFAAFTASTPDQMVEAIRATMENNQVRKDLTITCMAELAETEQPLAPWVYLVDTYPGMLGLLANQLMTRHGHPVVVVSRPQSMTEAVSGSARAPQWCDMISTTASHPHISAIGHQQACGVKLTSAQYLPDLAETLRLVTAVTMATGEVLTDQPDVRLGPDSDCDAPLHVGQMADLIGRLDGLKPFGHGFEAPRIELVVDSTGARVDRIGSQRQHVRIVTPLGLTCLWWNAAEAYADRLAQWADRKQPWRLMAQLQLNTFRGVTRVQAIVDQWVNHD